MTTVTTTAETRLPETRLPETRLPETMPRKPRAPRPPPVAVTPAAVERVRALLAKRGKPSLGVRVGVRTRGCSGLSYTLEYADAVEAGDEMIRPAEDITILIAPKAAMFLFGTEMDFVEENLKSGFTFRNPNEKGRCGCGESFHV